ncbi:MAG: hypothetical protein WKF87_20850 [Chryseolinea sp.]
MKTTILLFAAVLGYITPTYSQLNRDREEVPSELYQNKLNYDFGNVNFDKSGNYKFDIFNNFLRTRDRDTLNWLPTRPAPGKSVEKIYSGDNMPCFHPKSGDNMPCSEPTGTFPMRVFKPKNVIWGILW